MSNSQKKEPVSPAENAQQTQDFPNIPGSDKNVNPPNIDQEDVEKLSEIHDSGKTDNTEENN